MRLPRAVLLPLLFLATASPFAQVPLADPIPGSIPAGPFTVRLDPVAAGLVFPTDVAAFPDGSGRLLITQREGKILLVDGGVVQAVPFLDISSTTVLDSGSAMSSVVFHPEFGVAGLPGERKLYTVSQEAAGTGTADFGDPAGAAHQSVIYEWQARADDPNLVDTATRREVLRIDNSTTVHDLDELAFGPDGLLYVSNGDDDATSTDVLDGTVIQGAVLRLDVDAPGSSPGYAVPPDNPFVGDPAGRIPEIWAYGFRNPWEMGFDRNTGALYLADIGEDDIEEIDLIERGRYYGWNDKEGSFVFLDFTGVSDDLGLLPPDFDGVDPIAQYDHTEGDRSITGGFVYRGTALPELRGHYVFGDFVSGRLMHVAPNEGVVRLLAIDGAGEPLGPGLIGIGEDAGGELLLVVSEWNFDPTGRVLRIGGLTATPPDHPPAVPDGQMGTPLRARRIDPAGDTLELGWDTTTCVEARGYHLLWGYGSGLPATPGGTIAPAGAVCDVGVTAPWIWRNAPDPTGDSSGLVWFLLVAHDGLGSEGSWGADDSGAERFGPGPAGSSGECGITSRDLTSACGQ